MAAVAKELGVSNATLFLRAKTKDELLYRALKPPAPVALEMLNRGPEAGADLRPQLLNILFSLCKFFPEAAPAGLLLASAGLLRRFDGDLDPPKVLRRALTRWLRRAKFRGLPLRNPRVISDLLIGSLEARYQWAYICNEKYTASQDKAFLIRLLNQLIDTPQSP
jgi:AcrR family transcriptional regulator